MVGWIWEGNWAWYSICRAAYVGLRDSKYYDSLDRLKGPIMFSDGNFSPETRYWYGCNWKIYQSIH